MGGVLHIQGQGLILTKHVFWAWPTYQFTEACVTPIREMLSVCPQTETPGAKATCLRSQTRREAEQRAESWACSEETLPVKAARLTPAWSPGVQGPPACPWGRPSHGVHSTSICGAPVCWVQSPGEASKVPVLVELTPQKRTKDRVPTVALSLITHSVTL